MRKTADDLRQPQRPQLHLPLFALIACLTGCANLEATVILGPRVSERDTEIAATITAAYKFKGRKVCQFTHNSVVNKGDPFNDEPEVTFDHVGCGFRFGR